MNTLDQPSVTFRPSAFLSGTPGLWAGHLPFACDLITALRPQVFVELGVGYGDSYFGVCQAVAESNLTCTCYGVDTWHEESPSSSCGSSIYDAVSRHNDRYYRSFSYLLRSTFDNALSQFSEQSISLLHLDGSRTYEAAKHDFYNWIPKVKAGGIILLHDITVRTGDFSIWRLWEELQREYAHFAFRNSNGLGVLWKPGESYEKNAYLRELFSSSKENQERIRRYYSLCADHLELEHRLSVSRAIDAGQSQVQVITMGGEGRGEHKLTQIVDTGRWTNVFIRLADGPGDKPIRIAPASRAGIVDISGIVLRKAEGRTVWSWNSPEKMEAFRIEGTAYQLPSHDTLRILSFGGNPQMILPDLPGVDANEPLELEMRLKVDLEFRAVHEVAQKAAELQRGRADWEKKSKQEMTELEIESGKQARLKMEGEQLVRKGEEAKLALQQKQEQTIRSLVRQHEESKMILQKQIEEAIRQQEEGKKAIVQQFEQVREELERRLAQAEEQLDQQRKAQLATAAEHEKAQATHRLLAQELSIARGNVEDLKAEIERLTTVQTEVQSELLEARKANSRLAATLDQERLRRAMMESTRSWQMTKPLRNVADLFKSSPKS